MIFLTVLCFRVMGVKPETAGIIAAAVILDFGLGACEHCSDGDFYPRKKSVLVVPRYVGILVTATREEATTYSTKIGECDLPYGNLPNIIG
jgi:hypothetical protein